MSAILRVRKRPIEVQAMLYDGTNGEAVCAWVNTRPDLVAAHALAGKYALIIPTLEGPMTALVGDYIVCGIKGEFYPVKPDVFERSYEVLP